MVGVEVVATSLQVATSSLRWKMECHDSMERMPSFCRSRRSGLAYAYPRYVILVALDIP